MLVWPQQVLCRFQVVFQLLAELPVFDRVGVNECVLSQVNNLPPDAGGERPPPAALQVARCMVLLV